MALRAVNGSAVSTADEVAAGTDGTSIALRFARAGPRDKDTAEGQRGGLLSASRTAITLHFSGRHSEEPAHCSEEFHGGVMVELDPC
eukprot:gene42070-51084_t